MSIDPQTLINAAVAGAMAVGGWFARELWSAVSDLRRDVRQIEIDLPSYYLRKDEFREGLNEIKGILREIFMKIDNLQDKKADK